MISNLHAQIVMGFYNEPSKTSRPRVRDELRTGLPTPPKRKPHVLVILGLYWSNIGKMENRMETTRV